ncbi:hypothetical protein H257_02023 [Aphanomyces astaci]|uniref:CCHC-type domain-containing protein n=1 Tax=Aphanomyces astaci TaxID=112090 RepID=W4H603_APHAT|nr:hypothetical protein H257_02023 [Aphanomyces astaci]ETV87011.1 hypothetical protein H257_02023 [Aphanomyces astaci]|eukprot:XP_009823810.1 hypothetical protein H257_02023 [Aphanomyces astaci]
MAESTVYSARPRSIPLALRETCSATTRVQVLALPFQWQRLYFNHRRYTSSFVLICFVHQPRYHKPRVFDPLAVHLMLAEYSTAKQRSITTLPPPATESTASPTETTAPLLFFFHLLHDHIMNTHVTDPNRQVHRAPMSEEEKERRRLLRCQKESGKKRKLEHKQSVKDRLAAEIEAGVVDKWPKKCFNCNARTHEARECPVVCRHCKVQVHFNGDCPMKGQRGPAREPKITKAL